MVTNAQDRFDSSIREMSQCLQAGVNRGFERVGEAADRSYVAIRETNAELIRGFGEAIKEIKPVIQKSTVAIARAELVMDALAPRSNGHG